MIYKFLSTIKSGVQQWSDTITLLFVNYIHLIIWRIPSFLFFYQFLCEKNLVSKIIIPIYMEPFGTINFRIQ